MRTLDLVKMQADAIRQLVSKYGSSNPRLFGSVLKYENTDSSDIDVLVDASPSTTLFDLGALQQELEQLLRHPVDLLTPEDLPVKFRHQVLLEAQAI